MPCGGGGDPNAVEYFIQESGTYTDPDTGINYTWGGDSNFVAASPILSSAVINTATFDNNGIALEITPPSLPPATSIWGYRVEVSTNPDGTNSDDCGQIAPVDGQSPPNPLQFEIQNCTDASTLPQDYYISVEALLGNPSMQSNTWSAPWSSYVQVGPNLDAPGINATAVNGTVSLAISPPSLPSGASVWGYRVEQATDAAGDGVFQEGEYFPANGQPPAMPLQFSACVPVTSCYYAVQVWVGDPTTGVSPWESPYSTFVAPTPVTPSVQVAPTSGKPAKAVTVSGGGFASGETVKVTYATGLKSPATELICKSVAAPDGSYRCSGKIPPTLTAGAKGTHHIKAKGVTSKLKATATFTLT